MPSDILPPGTSVKLMEVHLDNDGPFVVFHEMFKGQVPQETVDRCAREVRDALHKVINAFEEAGSPKDRFEVQLHPNKYTGVH